MQNGITLIALVISIIVMLILAGVSINAVVGDNGVLTKAKEAGIASKKASILEELNLKLAGYNINTLTDKDVGTKQILTELISEGYIDTVLNSGGKYVSDANAILPVPRFDEENNYTGEFAYGVKKDDYAINIYTANDGIYKAEYGEISFSSGGSVQAGTVLVTKDSFNSSEDVSDEDKGKYSIDSDSNIIFIDTIEGELSFHIKSGAHAKINIFNDMTLTNEGMSRSAIDIEPNGILDLYIASGATLTVDSGYGEQGEDNLTNQNGMLGGPGGYAGIHVPSNKNGKAILNLSGDGILIAYGGDAGDGGKCGTVDYHGGGAGGGGAGAGIGGSGGKGGDASKGTGHKSYVGDGKTSGYDGESGEDAGIITIRNSLKVYAYGGGGGSGGNSLQVHLGEPAAGAGGGGYPAAGIGGGGAGGGGGGEDGASGGYSGSAAENSMVGAVNGLSTNSFWVNNSDRGDFRGGSGYYTYDNNNKGFAGHSFGLGSIRLFSKTSSFGGEISDTQGPYGSGGGGIAGSGGTIKVSNQAKIYAFNGDRITNGDYETIYYQYDKDGNQTSEVARVITKSNNKKMIPAYIFLQAGIQRAVYTYNPIMSDSIKEKFKIIRDWNVVEQIEIIPEKTDIKNFGQGIGSGAGYIEVSNGTYTVDNSFN